MTGMDHGAWGMQRASQLRERHVAEYSYTDLRYTILEKLCQGEGLWVACASRFPSSVRTLLFRPVAFAPSGLDAPRFIFSMTTRRAQLSLDVYKHRRCIYYLCL